MIPHSQPTLGADEQHAVARVIASGWVAQGEEVAAFEDELCQFLDLPAGHTVAVSSGTSALYLALWVLGAKGMRVGLPVYACAALRNAVGMIQGRPVYLDCEPNSPNVSFAAAQNANIDILISPSMYGIPAVPGSDRGYKLIEDLAQALGAAIDGTKLGHFGEVAICSFYATKLITSGGQGGAVVSRDKTLIDAVRDYRQFDCREDSKLRFNFQMTDLQAAVGRVQLKKLPEFLSKRQELFEMYRQKGLTLLGVDEQKYEPVRYRAVLQCNDSSSLQETLLDHNIEAIVPIETWELLAEPRRYPISKALTESTLSLPLYPSLTHRDGNSIAKLLLEFL